MKFSAFLCTDAIVPQLVGTDRDAVIRELVDALAEAKQLPSEAVEPVTRSILQRERQGSTGFGKGVAVPHVKHAAVPRMMSTIGRSPTGVDFAALDRAPVYSIVLLLSPPEHPEQHLEAMEKIFRHLQQDQFRSFLRQAESKESIADLIRDADM